MPSCRFICFVGVIVMALLFSLSFSQAFQRKPATGIKTIDPAQPAGENAGATPPIPNADRPASIVKSASISQLYVEDNTIHVLLRNTDAVSSDQLVCLRLKICVGTIEREWPFSRVLATPGLGRHKGEVIFDTGIVLKKMQLVTALIVGGPVSQPLQWRLASLQKPKPVAGQTGVTSGAARPVMVPRSTSTSTSPKPFRPISPPAMKPVATSGQDTRAVLGADAIDPEVLELPIEILSPAAGDRQEWGTRILIRYRIRANTDAGNVFFKLHTSTRRDIAEMVHFYEPPDQSDILAMNNNPKSGGASPIANSVLEDYGRQDRLFGRLLPPGDDLPEGDDFYITAHKLGGISGRSATFSIRSSESGCTEVGRRVLADRYSALRFHGDTVRVRFNFCGCSPFQETVGNDFFIPVFILPADWRWGFPTPTFTPFSLESIDAERLSGILQVTLPDSLEPDREYAIFIIKDRSCYANTEPFIVQSLSHRAPLTISAPTASDVYHRGESIDVLFEPVGRSLEAEVAWWLECTPSPIGCYPSGCEANKVGSARQHNGRFQITIPDTFPDCDHARIHVQVRATEEGCRLNCPKFSGQSQPFRTDIRAQNDGYIITSPRYGQTFHPGDTVPVQMTMVGGGNPPPTVGLFLLQTNASMIAYHSATWGAFDLPIPEDLVIWRAAEEFQVIIFDEDNSSGRRARSAFSTRFLIVSPDGGD